MQKKVEKGKKFYEILILKLKHKIVFNKTMAR